MYTDLPVLFLFTKKASQITMSANGKKGRGGEGGGELMT